MAKVLSWLPDGFMRSSLGTRSAKATAANGANGGTGGDADAAAEDELALESAGSKSKTKRNGATEEEIEDSEQDAEGEPDDEEEDAEAEPEAEAEDDDEYHDAAPETEEPSARSKRAAAAARRRAPPKARGRAQRSSRRLDAKNKDPSESQESEPDVDEDDEDGDGEAPWEAENDEVDEDEAESIAEASHCVFCGKDENDDPGEDFEEVLSCVTCDSKAHRHCAREANAFDEDDDSWFCNKCHQDGDPAAPSAQHHRSDSAPKIARDLLPYQRGAPKPGSHSIFNKLIVEDDPLDGSRALRKRKSSDADEERTDSRKRQRRATSDVDRTRGYSADRGTSPKSGALNNNNTEEADQSAGNTAPRVARSRGTRRTERQLVTIVEPRTDDCLTLAFHLGSEKLRNLDEEKRKRRRRERERARRTISYQEMPEANHYPALQPQSFVFQSLFDRDGDESKAKPYGGILSEAEADTTKTFPVSADRKRFEDARQKAEQDWRRKVEEQREAEAAKVHQKSAGPPTKVKCINFAGYEIDTWHAAPYPEEYSRNRVLYICEFCLKYMNSDFVAWRHKLKCPAKHPPGDEIYRDGAISFFEVDGRKNPVYCQNLCLLAKLFLGSKTLYYDVEPFLFYVMTESDEYGCHFVGYFSKEKRPSSQNNVSCILVLPIHQRRGFGNLLIEFSYLLTRVEGKTGSPEKPLSDMGLVTYRSYWRLVLCNQLLNLQGPVSITKLSALTGMTADDIVCGLEGLRALVRDPVTKTYALRLDHAYYKRYVDNYKAKGYVELNPEALMWVPYVMGRDNMHYENAAPLHTVAQRDDDQEASADAEVDAPLVNGNKDTTASEDATTPADTTANDTVPFPSLDDAEKQQSPTRIMPNTPFADNPTQPASPIPATRFEVFPPLPGTAAKRRLGRPPRSGRKSTPYGPAAMQHLDSSTGATADKPPGSRRGRSHLAEEINGDDDDEGDAAGEADEEGSPSAGRHAGTADEDVEMADAKGDAE